MRPSRPVLHGDDHGPGGPDPSPTGVWHNIGDPGEPALLAGDNQTASTAIPNPVPMRFRLAVGRQNVLTVDGTAVVTYTRHQVEIQGDVTGLAVGDVVFVLPLAYRHDHDVPVAAHDDDGNYVPCRLYSSGEFIYGVA